MPAIYIDWLRLSKRVSSKKLIFFKVIVNLAPRRLSKFWAGGRTFSFHAWYRSRAWHRSRFLRLLWADKVETFLDRLNLFFVNKTSFVIWSFVVEKTVKGWRYLRKEKVVKWIIKIGEEWGPTQSLLIELLYLLVHHRGPRYGQAR